MAYQSLSESPYQFSLIITEKYINSKKSGETLNPPQIVLIVLSSYLFSFLLSKTLTIRNKNRVKKLTASSSHQAHYPFTNKIVKTGSGVFLSKRKRLLALETYESVIFYHCSQTIKRYILKI